MGFINIIICLIIFECICSSRQETYVRKRLGSPPQTCDIGSCYPATGNLLIGRENKLSASSTCGLHKQERFCIVSHLEERKKCFWCDSRPHTRSNPSLNHEISNIVYNNPFSPQHNQSWWQSENGVENVTIQLDMEAEFHFTHLVIKFKTFRPAAMLIERSHDRGKTWQVYKYFAFDCGQSFPHVRRGTRQSLNDVVCTDKYSQIGPSTLGELIFRVLPPSIQVDDPFAPEVQDLVKMTNLRINFTKLHTLGDNLLDKRSEIQEKYYYAIYSMIVRGSCSCYGHANRCLPLIEEGYRPSHKDMVHGQCECTHNTKGRNCEECEDFYNDLPWKPAFGKSQNACKRCNCNNHATSCHYDQAVFEMTGNVTGGVCENCQHNTQGRNCEQCRDFYYHNPEVDMQHPEACQHCDCDPRGSLDDGICDSHTDPAHEMVAGRCHCKRFVDGRRCDRCKNGFWNFDENNVDGCQACECDPLGTADQQGCDVNSGGCTCKRYVTGRRCNQCLPEYYGLSEDRNGCKPCECDKGGSYDNNCDVISGECRCRPHVTGRTCDKPEQGYFAGDLDFHVYEAELAKATEDVQVVIREPDRDQLYTSWTGTGLVRAFENSELDFLIDNIHTPRLYDIILRFEPQLPGGWGDVEVVLDKPDDIDRNGPCANSLSDSSPRHLQLTSDSSNVVVFPPVCLEPGHQYNLHVKLNNYDPSSDTTSPSLLIDSVVLVPRVDEMPFFHGTPENEYSRQEYDNYRCGDVNSVYHSSVPAVCDKYRYSIGFLVHNGTFKCNCDPTGSKSAFCEDLGGQCDCKPNIVGRQCDRCAPGTFGFGPNGCSACDCNPLSLDNFCDQASGQCKCRVNIVGRECDQCRPGFWNFPNCLRCECNGHADTCDSKTGQCINCRGYTTGHNCNECIEGYYGDPQIGIDIPCRPCPCPGSVDSGNSFATSCSLDPRTQDVVCECDIGYSGPRCEECADNYYGSPEVPGGSCQQCNCSNNIDISRPGNCDPHTGHCLQCLFNTEGPNCEVCKDKYYGDAINQQCRECVCDILGTNHTASSCDGITGQCVCLPNVTGRSCDQCLENHWKIASGSGCEPCDCDDTGSYSKQCNLFDGQCDCEPGFGSRRCDQCQAEYWGDPKVECRKCECNVEGSATLQCNRNNGTCVCIDGIGGAKCDECARGYLGNAPNCTSCGECFKNWDDILNELMEQTERVIAEATNIKQTGVQGAYTQQFIKMQEQIDRIKQLLHNTSISTQNLTVLQSTITELRDELTQATDNLNKTTGSLENTKQRIDIARLSLVDLGGQVDKLLSSARSLKENATKLQEANVEGALNLTRNAQRQSQTAEATANAIANEILATSERQCKRTSSLHAQQEPRINNDLLHNEKTLFNLTDTLDNLKSQLPSLNEMVCGKAVETCSDLCGGAGCGFCGGISCSAGAVSKSSQAAEITDRIEDAIKEKEGKVEGHLRNITQAKREAVAARNAAEEAYRAAKHVETSSLQASNESGKFFEKYEKFMKTPGAKSSEIRKLAEETQALKLNYQPDEISNLVTQTQVALKNLTNIEGILSETNDDKAMVSDLKNRANRAKADSESILNIVQKVTMALDEASMAQSKADQAIKQANGDIAAAENDLEQIGSESIEAQQKVNDTMNTVKDLNERFQNLQKKFIQNNLGSKEIEKEVAGVSIEAESISDKINKLKSQYAEAENSLNVRASKSELARKRAMQLRQLASVLYQNTAKKERELKELEVNYDEQGKTLSALEDEMKELGERMQQYIKGINERSTYYSTCTS